MPPASPEPAAASQLSTGQPVTAVDGQSASALDSLLQSMPWATLVLAPDGRIASLNAAATALWGLPATALLAQVPDQVQPAVLPEALLTALRQALVQSLAAPREYWLPHTRRWVEMSVAPGPQGHVWVYWHDVTEARQREADSQALSDNNPDAISRWDQELRLVYANAAYAEQVGRPLAELLGKTCREMDLPDSLAGPWMARLRLVFDTGELQEHHYLSATAQGAAHYHARFVPEPREGAVHFVLVIARDVPALRRAQQELRQQAYFTDKITNSTPDLIYVLALNGPQVTYINERVRTVLGTPPEAVTADGAQVFRRALHPDDLARRLTHVAACRSLTDDEVRYIDVRLRVVNGTYRWFRIRDRVFQRSPDGRVTHLISLGQDIDDQRRAELELRESRDLLQAVFETVPHSLMVLAAVRDDQGRIVDFRYLLSNGVADRFLGLDITKSTQRALLGGFSDDSHFRTLVETVETGQPAQREHPYQTGGKSLWLRTRYRRLGDGVVMVHENVTVSKQAEAELRDSHALLHAIFEALPLNLSYSRVLRDEQGRAVDFVLEAVNQNSLTHIGQTRDVIGRRVTEVLPGLRTLPFFQTLFRAAETGLPHREESHYQASQADVWSLVSTTPLGDGLLVAGLDITERKQMELALQEANIRLSRANSTIHRMLDGSLAAICLMEAIRDEQSGQIVDFVYRGTNRAAEFFSPPNNQLLGQYMLSQFPRLRDSFFVDYVRVVETGEPMRAERFHVRDNGQQLWFDVSAVKNDDGFILTFLDISERKQIELALREANAMLEAMFNASQLAFVVYRAVYGPDGQVADFEFVRLNAVANTWYQNRSLVGLRLGEVFPEVRKQGLLARYARCLTSGVPADLELRYEESGRVSWHRITGRPLDDLLFVTSEDITGRKQAEQDRLSQQQHLANAVLAAQEAERQRIAESLHNGLAQLLYAVRLRVDQLASLTDPQQLTTVRQQASTYIVEAIRQTRSISHELVPSILRDFGLDAALHDICRKLGTPQRQLHYAIQGLSPGRLDSSLELALYRMAQELANNIVKHADATEASLEIDADGDTVTLQATDNGRGFGPGTASMGMGLKSIQDRVELLNGHMEVKGVPGRGTRIRIALPLV